MRKTLVSPLAGAVLASVASMATRGDTEDYPQNNDSVVWPKQAQNVYEMERDIRSKRHGAERMG